MPSERGSSHLGEATPEQGPTGGFPGVGDILLTSSPGNSPERDLGAHGSGLLASIDALVVSLLAHEARIDENSLTSGVLDSGIAGPGTVHGWERQGEGMQLNGSSFDLSDDLEAESGGRLPAGSSWVVPSEMIGQTHDLHTDAETFAALVNDVLVRQARRHGVDLS
jgi:hypothetical protein